MGVWVRGGRGGGGGRRGGHQGEDGVQREGADEREAVDVSEMDFSRKEQEGAEEEEEEDGAREVGVVHYVLVDAGEGVEHRECLLSYISSVRPLLHKPKKGAWLRYRCFRRPANLFVGWIWGIGWR